jgi:antitoxin component YwqK of YwqJK toxin-antitoxin module
MYEEGEYQDGQLHGSGKVYYPNGRCEYDGTWDNGDLLRGREYTPQGVLRYKGQFKSKHQGGDFVWHGIGEWYHPSGEVYFRGIFKDGRPSRRDSQLCVSG